MLKIAAIVSLMLIGSTLWAAGLSCESCGRECASACGTRHFRACCFNYLRRKRTNIATEVNKFWPPKTRENKMEELQRMTKKIPIFAIEDVPVPEPWTNNIAGSNEFEPYPFEDTLDNRMQNVFN